MTDHTIKLNRARKQCRVGNYPATYDAISRHVPAVIIAGCSAAQIAAVVDALHACAQEAKGAALRDAAAEGVVWDARQQRHREVAA
jgi:hypothetical protein